MKINISCDWGGTITNYELRREVPLFEHIDTICKEFKAPESSENYALFVDASYTYIKAEVGSSQFQFVLCVRPICYIFPTPRPQLIVSTMCYVIRIWGM